MTITSQGMFRTVSQLYHKFACVSQIMGIMTGVHETLLYFVSTVNILAHPDV